MAIEDQEEDLDFEGKQEPEEDEAKEKQEQYQLRKLLEKDEQARKVAFEAGNRASREALKEGLLSAEEIANITRTEMMRALKEFKPSNVTTEKGLDNAFKVRDMFIEAENEREGIFTYEIEINDLQPIIRMKVQSKDFIGQIQEMTSCQVHSKGVFVEAGKKPPLGSKKQHLSIEGTSKQNVQNAYNEIKR